MPVRTSYKQGTPSWVDLATNDQDAAKKFYGSLFGWGWEDNDMGNGQFYSMAQLKGHTAAGVFTQPPDEDRNVIPPHWNTYITVNDVDATVKKVIPAGGSVMAEPFDVFDSGRMALVTDPTGGIIAFWQPVKSIGAEIVTEPGAIAWNEFITDDVEKAGAFFKEVLGVEVVSQTEPFPYTTINVDGDMVGGMMAKTPEMGEMPNVWALYFAVADCDSTVKKAESLGGKTLMQPMDSPPGRFATIQDPQGAIFSVIKLNQ